MRQKKKTHGEKDKTHGKKKKPHGKKNNLKAKVKDSYNFVHYSFRAIEMIDEYDFCVCGNN